MKKRFCLYFYREHIFKSGDYSCVEKRLFSFENKTYKTLDPQKKNYLGG